MNDTDKEHLNFPIIGIGASAGGLAEFEKFFKNSPKNIGMAFIIIQHLDPDHESNLVSILKKYTILSISEAEDDMNVKKDHVYVIPPNRKLSIKNRIIEIEEFAEPRGKRFPIDYLFRSLADDLKEKSIGIILSGTGTDGTSGLRSIKGVGGMAMVQDPNTTEYSGMPFSAINKASIDYIVPTEEMPAKLKQYIEFLYGKLKNKDKISTQQIITTLDEVYDIIRSQTGHEFSVYKNTTILRRIEKRMSINQINDLDDYLQFLRANRDEIDKLYHDLLIGVTSFFRDKGSFDALEEKVIRPLIKLHEKRGSIRVWVPGCSTGEEAYSIAILLYDNMEKMNKRLELQIFATDIDDHAIEVARKGVFKHNIVIDVPDNLLATYFHKKNDDYCVTKRIRNSVVFAVQNVLSDPPFSNIDLISCRNLLIYLQSDIQEKLFNLFKYSLKSGGFLFLGNSESLGNDNILFEAFDRKNKIFQATHAEYSYMGGFGSVFPPLFDVAKKDSHSQIITDRTTSLDYGKIMRDALFETFTHPTLLVNSNYDIIYIHGNTSKYLEHSSGKPSLNLKKVIRDKIRTEVVATLRKVEQTKQKTEFRNIRFQYNDYVVIFNLNIRPVSNDNGKEDLYLIVFEEKKSDFNEDFNEFSLSHPEKKIEDFNQVRLQQLEDELESTKSQLKTTIGELEATNQELKSTNEEYLSANEELKSTNEEIQTSKEELQSVNEELITVNNELNSKIEELSNTNDDLNNLISSTEIGTLFLDKELNIRRFTESLKNLFRFRDSDEGRQLNDISSNLKKINIIRNARKVLEKLNPIECDVETEDEKREKWYRMKIVPYMTEENVIDGVVLTFMDITERKKAEKRLKKSENKFRNAYNQMKFYEDLFSHDMRNILQVILSSTETAINKFEDYQNNKDQLMELIQITEEQVRRGFKLIMNIQKLSSFDEALNSSQTVDLVPLLNNSAENVQKMFKNQNIEFKFDIFEDDITVNATNLLEDVFENIFINSVKYNDKLAKKIWVCINRTLKIDMPYLKIEIADNGTGIANNLKKKLFKEKIDSTYSKGMGIGLTIVKKIIDLYQGDISVEDRLEGNEVIGTRMIITLPIP
ncbi:MAG: hypothetical protein GF317_05160 [Candidatus Lokiarchaeota archaeon]|nr:hypothetical protein [Candidatus Lokiarchaeota archaeon]MBD3199195.1 hypothetical protein [Candidatus Lokiarchaeota archaeon]